MPRGPSHRATAAGVALLSIAAVGGVNVALRLADWTAAGVVAGALAACYVPVAALRTSGRFARDRYVCETARPERLLRTAPVLLAGVAAGLATGLSATLLLPASLGVAAVLLAVAASYAVGSASAARLHDTWLEQ